MTNRSEPRSAGTARSGGRPDRAGRTTRSRATTTTRVRPGNGARPAAATARRLRGTTPVSSAARGTIRGAAASRAYARRNERSRRLRHVASGRTATVPARRVPFVALVILLLAGGLVGTLWLSSRSADNAYDIGQAQEANERLSEEAQALRRDVAVADSTSILAQRAMALGMVPAGEVAHLVVGTDGAVTVVGTPEAATAPPPPEPAVPAPVAPASPDVAPASPDVAPASPDVAPDADPSPGPDTGATDTEATDSDTADTPAGITAGVDPDPNSEGA